jgi:hypothetical protein
MAYAPERAWGTYCLGALGLALGLGLACEDAGIDGARLEGPATSMSERSDMPSGRGEVDGCRTFLRSEHQ